MISLREEDPTDPAPAPAPTSKEDRMTEEVPADSSIPATNGTNMMTTTEVAHFYIHSAEKRVGT